MEPNMDMFSSAAENRNLEDELPPPAPVYFRRNRNIQGSALSPPEQISNFPIEAFSCTPKPGGVQDTPTPAAQFNPNIGGAGSSQPLQEHLTDASVIQLESLHHQFPSGDLQGGPDYDHSFQSQHGGQDFCPQNSALQLPGESFPPQELSFTWEELLGNADTQQQILLGGRGQQQLASDPLAEETPAKNNKRSRSSAHNDARELSKDQLFRLRKKMKDKQTEKDLQTLRDEGMEKQWTIVHLTEEKDHVNQLLESTLCDLMRAREDLAVWKKKHEDQEKQIESLSINLEKTEEELKKLREEDVEKDWTIDHLKEENERINKVLESAQSNLARVREDLALLKKSEDQEKQIEAYMVCREKVEGIDSELKKLQEETKEKDWTIKHLKEEIASINAEKAHNKFHESAQSNIEQQLKNLTCQVEKNNVDLLEKVHSVLLHVENNKNEQEELNKLRGQTGEKDQVIELLKENYADLEKAHIDKLLEFSKSDLDYVMDKLTLFKKKDVQQQVEARLHKLRRGEMWEIEGKMEKVRGATEEVTEQQRNITEVRLKSQELQSHCRQLREETDAILNSQAIEAGISKPRQVADLLLFSKRLSWTDIRRRFSIPTSALQHFDLTQGVYFVDLRVRDTSGHIWIFKVAKRAARWAKPCVSVGWLQFVREKELLGGDNVYFYKKQNYDPEAEYRIEVRRGMRLFGEDAFETVA